MTPVMWALLLLVGSVLLLFTLAGLVLGRKLSRDKRESESSGRRQRFIRAVKWGSHDELVTVMRQAGASPRAMIDLVVAIDMSGPRYRAAQLDRLHGAAEAAGLIERCEEVLRSRKPTARGRAVLLLGRLRLPDGPALLEPLVSDNDSDVRHAAVAAIAQAESEDAARVLIRALSDGKVTPERVIERLAGPWSVDVCLAALEDPATEGEGRRAPRVSIARTLGLAGDVRAEPALNRLLLSGHIEERISAARALGQIGGPESRPALTLALAEHHPWPLRAQAAKALGELGNPKAASRLEAMLDDQAWWVRANAANALRQLGPAGIAALERATRHPDRYARDRAREALALEAVAAARRGSKEPAAA